MTIVAEGRGSTWTARCRLYPAFGAVLNLFSTLLLPSPGYFLQPGEREGGRGGGYGGDRGGYGDKKMGPGGGDFNPEFQRVRGRGNTEMVVMYFFQCRLGIVLINVYAVGT